MLVLSTCLSSNPLQSAQGSYERMQGAITQLCYLALYLLIVDRLTTPAQLARLFRAIALGSVPVVIYGLLQALGLDPVAWQAEGSPVIGTLGRSNFVGAYLVLVVPVTCACIVQAGAGPARGPARRAAYIALMVSQGICLGVAMSRAAWLGAAAAGAVSSPERCLDPGIS